MLAFSPKTKILIPFLKVYFFLETGNGKYIFVFEKSNRCAQLKRVKNARRGDGTRLR